MAEDPPSIFIFFVVFPSCIFCRLFEEENKVEKKISKLRNPASTSGKKLTKGMGFQFHQWPATQSSSILVLSDDED